MDMPSQMHRLYFLLFLSVTKFPGVRASEISEFSPVIPQLTCISCGQGRFLSSFSQQCEDCPSNSNTLDGSNATEIGNCACDRGHFNSSHDCHECDPGFFKTSPGDIPCTTCHAGSSTDFTGATDPSSCICNAGSYETNALQCDECVPGTFKGVNGNQACQVCDANAYCPSASVAPISCPEDSTSPQGSTQLSDCHCEPGFHRDDQRNCQSCDAGKFQPLTNQPECNLCPHHSFQPELGADSPDDCQSCDLNSFTVAAGSNKQTDCLCNVGFSGNPGSSCLECEPGSYRSDLSEYICASCGVNHYNEFHAATSVDFCEGCPVSTSTNGLPRRGSSSACVCDPGFSAARESAAEDYTCSACPAGTFQQLHNSTRCERCEPGTYSTTEKATDETTCTDCDDGSFSIGSAQTECTSCPRDTWQDALELGVKTRECSLCPDFSGHALLGVTDVNLCVCKPGRVGRGSDGEYECRECEPGSFCPGDRVQTVCPANSWSPGGNFSGPCVPCAVNSRTVPDTVPVVANDGPESCFCRRGAEGSFDTACTLCETGKFREKFDGSQPSLCQACPPNTFADETGSIACQLCPSHTSSPTNSHNQSFCECNAGYYGPSGGPCALCPSDNYCPGGHAYYPCMLHGESLAGTFARLNCSCSSGYYATALGGKCAPCERGYYCPGGLNRYQCSGNSTSTWLSPAVDSCQCDDGYWRGCVQNSAGQSIDRAGQACVIDFYRSCELCGSDHICVNSTRTHCPRNSGAPPGSHDDDACICDGGYEEKHHTPH